MQRRETTAYWKRIEPGVGRIPRFPLPHQRAIFGEQVADTREVPAHDRDGGLDGASKVGRTRRTQLGQLWSKLGGQALAQPAASNRDALFHRRYWQPQL